MDKLKMHSLDKGKENIEKIGALFPGCITERKDENGRMERAVDFDMLRQELSCAITEGNEERYRFTWPDKKKAVRLANVPTEKTLRPCREGSVRFDTTGNLYIEGDNLEVLKLLQETYLHKVKMIYIDPPYNTGNNLIYKNDFSQGIKEYAGKSGQLDEDGNMLVANPDTNGRFHTDWLNMMYPRIKLAKDLLAEDGVFVCAIDENEFATLSIVLKEIFGESAYEHSYVSVVHNPRGQQGNNFSYVNEYLIFVYPADNKKYLADFPKDTVDARNLRDSGTDSDRTNARNCFYPFFVKDGKITGIGEIPEADFHPGAANLVRRDGITEVWPLSESGEEKKWRYARQTVETILDQLEVKSGRSSLQIIFNKSEGTMKSVWANARYDASEYGTKLVQELLGDSGFTYPKSLYAVYDAVTAAVKHCKDAIVMDFFAGSSTTAHAVMKLNMEDGGQRKFIMVQVPEPVKEKTNAYQMGYRTICDIGKDRIRKAAEQMLAENPAAASGCDFGFRDLILDTSNMKDVYYSPAEFEPELFDSVTDNIKEDRTPEDLLFQVMLELGVLPSSKLEESIIAGKKVFRVADGMLAACFDETVTEETIREIAKQKPVYFVMRDSSMASDSVAENFEQIFATYSPDTVRKVL